MRHGAKRKTCSHEGCTNQVRKGGVYVRHGAEKKTCKHEGCTKRFSRKAFVLDTVQSNKERLANMKDVQIMQRKEEFASDTGQKSRDAVLKDVTI